MRRLIGRILYVLSITLGTWSAGCNKAPVVDPKEKELASLPVGMEVVHTPNPVKAQVDSSHGYRCVYATTVKPTGGPLTIQEFGAFGWKNGRWSFGTMTGRPFTAQDFANWYACPGGRLEQSNQYSDFHNFSGGSIRGESKTKWYYIAVNEKGERVKGEAVVEETQGTGGAGGIFDPTETDFEHEATKAIFTLLIIGVIVAVVIARTKGTAGPPGGFPPPGFRPLPGHSPFNHSAPGGVPPPLPLNAAPHRPPPPLPLSRPASSSFDAGDSRGSATGLDDSSE